MTDDPRKFFVLTSGTTEEGGKAPPPFTCVRTTEDELRAFVLGVCDGRILTSAQVEPNILGMVFMPIAFGLVSRCANPTDIGVVWEWMSEAGPRGINGYPMFLSCNVMHLEDWTRAREAIRLEIDRRERIEV